MTFIGGQKYWDIKVPLIKHKNLIKIPDDLKIDNNIFKYYPKYDTGYEIVMVSERSPLIYKKALEDIAYYFKREMKTDFSQYEANEKQNNKKLRGFIWVNEFPTEWRVVGGCCFRFREWDNFIPIWSFDWIWLHPYLRNKGFLKEYWNLFCFLFSPFILEYPLSKAMENFIKKQKYEIKKTTDNIEVSIYIL